MSSYQTLRIEVENFGPIRSGAFELHPLTLFVGASNTGKSYAAKLAHSIITSLNVFEHDRRVGPRLEPKREYRQLTAATVPRVLDSTFSCERYLQNLASKFADTDGCVRIKRLSDGGESLVFSVEIPRERGGSEKPPRPEPSCQSEFNEVDFLEGMAWALENLPRRSHYLPAARAGVLRGWQVMAAAYSAKPSGIIKEFLEGLNHAFRLSQKEPRSIELSPFQGVLKVLEGDLLGGEVGFLPLPEQPVPEVIYRVRVGEDEVAIPVQQVSAMVAELAPLVLWIKYLLNPREMLIIEEPEAHLHPENQRRVARALVRLVRAGVTVLCITHSPLILHQVSNHILAARADPARWKGLGFTEEDLLREEEVGVYLFRMREDGRGSEIQPLPIVPSFGIPEDEFVQVAEAIGEETYRLAGPLTIELGSEEDQE